jgi:hypothetical protein
VAVIVAALSQCQYRFWWWQDSSPIQVRVLPAWPFELR